MPVTCLIIANAVMIFKFEDQKFKAWEKSFIRYLAEFTEYLVYTEYSTLYK